jgi:hypothetical protein
MRTQHECRAIHSQRSRPASGAAKWVVDALLGACVLIAGAGCANENPTVSSRSSAPRAAAPMPLAVSQTDARPRTPTNATNVTNDGTTEDNSEPALFRQLDETFARKGDVSAGVYRLVTPRDDLFVTMDGMDVPTGAFLESDFRFWRCPCGKLLVNGQFVLADHEVNDVVDELQAGKLHVVSIGPLLLHEHPRLLVVRFQGEGRARELAGALKSALGYTGEARNPPLPKPADLAPPQE